MKRASFFFALLFGISAVGADCTGVTSLSDSASAEQCGEDGCFSTGGSSDAGLASDVTTDIGTDAPMYGGKPVNPLCGNLRCNPDDPEANECTSQAVDKGAEDDGGIDAGMKKPGSSGEPDSPGPGKFDAGSQDAMTAEGSSYACQVIRSPIGDRTSTCLPAGAGVDGSPCMSAEDCAPGRACVGYGAPGGVCRSYCCLDSSSCPEETYCAPRETRSGSKDGVSGSFFVPVCVPAASCDLIASNGSDSGCEDGKVCAVVRSNGTTGCVVPGSAKEGETCADASFEATGKSPCAAGLVCSRSTNKCVRFCRTGQDSTCGDGGFCQGGTTGIPEPYGVCISAR